MTNSENKRPESNLLGAGVALGTAAGAVLFSLTDNAVWIGLGAGIGVAIGAAIAQKRQG